MNRRLIRWRLIVLGAVLASAPACDGPVSPRQREADAARQRWLASGIVDYDFVVRRSCFCSMEVLQPLLIEVRGREAVSATSIQSGEVLGAVFATTIDRIFDDIDMALRKGSVIKAQYHPVLGYPIEANLDRVRQAIDDEVAYEILYFEAR